MNRTDSLSMGPDLMKMLRNVKLTRQQIADLLECDIGTVERWTREYEAHGILVAEQSSCPVVFSGRGPLPMLYTLAPTWLGAPA